MKTLVAGTQAIGEILEKRSRFITRIAPLGTENPEEQARQVVNEEKSTYPDARHHCSAFIVATDAGTTQTHTSDDGEPPGTAGAPILETLLGANLVNVVAVVTRYFGGTLLGTGGLVRAYAGATQQALKEAKLAEIVHLPQFWTSVPLEHAGKVEAEIRSRSWTIQNAQWGTRLELTFTVPREQKDSVEHVLAETTRTAPELHELGELRTEAPLPVPGSTS